jgi:hypothetical protein
VNNTHIFVGNMFEIYMCIYYIYLSLNIKYFILCMQLNVRTCSFTIPIWLWIFTFWDTRIGVYALFKCDHRIIWWWIIATNRFWFFLRWIIYVIWARSSLLGQWILLFHNSMQIIFYEIEHVVLSSLLWTNVSIHCIYSNSY